MTPNFLENVKVHLLTQAVTRYCMILAIRRKFELVFRKKIYIKKSDVENV